MAEAAHLIAPAQWSLDGLTGIAMFVLVGVFAVLEIRYWRGRR